MPEVCSVAGARVLAPVDTAGFPPVRRELVLAAALLALLGAVVYGPQVAHGGFYWDDWQNAANVHFTREPGLIGALDQATERPVFGYRPVLTGMLVLEYKALGLDKHLFLAVAALFGVLTGWALYLVLRTLGLTRIEAAFPAALLLVFPWTDSTRMWNTASFDTLAVTFYLLGLVVAILALRAPPGRRRTLLTAGSLVLYLLAAWTYEIVTFAILASGAVYLLVAPRRAALRRLGLDVVVVGIALAVVAAGTTRTPLSLGDQVKHAGTIAEQSFSVFTRALIPVGSLPGIVGAVLLVAISVVAYRRPDLRRWVWMAGLGALFTVAGYMLFVPAARYYEPLAPGTTNRMNVLAAVGFVVLVCALVRLAAGLLAGRRAPLAAAALLALIGVGYVVKVYDDQTGWHRSARVQQHVLDAVAATLPSPPPHSRIYTFDSPSFVAHGIPSFSLAFDLRSAVQLQYGDSSLAAYPIRGFDVIRCRARGLYPVGGTYGPVHGASYGRAYFVSVPRERAFRVDSQAQCEALRARLGA
jgi:hypothetical protein